MAHQRLELAGRSLARVVPHRGEGEGGGGGRHHDANRGEFEKEESHRVRRERR